MKDLFMTRVSVTGLKVRKASKTATFGGGGGTLKKK